MADEPLWLGVVACLVGALYYGVAASKRRLTRGLLTVLVPLAGLGVVFGWSLAHGSGRCDEACYPERGWSGTMDAWQWDALFWTSLTGGLAFAVAVVLAEDGRRTQALAALVTASAAFLAFAVLNAPLTSDY